MTTFRKLGKDELPLFEKEFKEYLAVNGIDADSWQKIKQNEPEKAEKLVDIFADVIFNSVLIKVNYLEHISANSIKYFKYEKEQATLIGLDGENVDFSNTKDMLSAVGDPSKKIEAFKLSKPYKKSREEELFDMIKNGCSISDGKLFEVLEKLV